MSAATYKKKARLLVDEFLRICGLDDSHRCTQIVVKKDLRHPIHKERLVWGYFWDTSDDKFILGLMSGMDDRKLAKVIGHEVCHIMTNGIIRGDDKEQSQWEEFTCDLVGRLLADRIKT